MSVGNIPFIEMPKEQLRQLDPQNFYFGKSFTNYMLEADYKDGAWTNAVIKKFEPLQIDPSTAVLHYGQSIFEGIKAYKTATDEVVIFRPEENYKRFNTSAERMQMPTVPEWLFLDGMKQLIKIEKDWIPKLEDHSLYIRPFMIATDPFIGVRPSALYKFMIILGPAGPYNSEPMKILIEKDFTRATPGGVGFAKNGGNYGASLYPVVLAQKKGYDQVLWTDALEHKYVEEVGMMNVMFVIDGKVITPSLERGTVLKGVTRASAIILLREMGYTVEERNLSIDEILTAHKAGKLEEVFGVGTAAVVSFICRLAEGDYVMDFDLTKSTVGPKLKKKLNDIRTGLEEDKHGWLVKI
ncbi:MAG: branched-chain amino acid aminotransferase [Chitinophagaceae bacterium]|nr:branched-chain amino acid aminotransferase [Chitinophagaceae bacterium]MCF8422388.1 branched-chain amino acid aminotransferase [Chitinophagaceae bacterium]